MSGGSRGSNRLDEAGQLACRKVGPSQSFGSVCTKYEVFEGAPSRVTGLYSVGRSFVGPSGLAGVKPLPRCDSPEGRSQEDGATLGHGSRKA